MSSNPGATNFDYLIESPDGTADDVSTPRKYKIIKHMVAIFAYEHIAGAYGLYLCFTEAKWATIVIAYVIYLFAGLGVTAGAHRLWSHRAYKAKLPLQILLMIMNTFAFQNTVINWVRDHREHHKYSETDADPHNSTRGFFYSHIGWLMLRKHPDVKKFGKNIDMSDINNNPVLKFQQKYALPFFGFVCFIIPTLIPVYFCGESFRVAWHITMLRIVVNLELTCLVNSVAHIWGYKPYDKSIKPVQNIFVALFTFGEGWHNYHHVFPWDYRAAELGNNYLNLSTKFIDFFAWVGWAYDLKIAGDDMVQKRMKRTGDGSNCWGWGDKCGEQQD